MSIRSWVRDKIEELGDFIVNKILTPFADFVRKQINNIIVALRIFRHNLKAKLAEWMENDLFFLLFIAATVVLIFKLSKWIGAAQKWWIDSYIKTVIKNIGERVVDIISINKLIDYVMLHKILLVLWDDYREVSYSFADAVSQLSSELGEGSAYLHAYFASLRGIMHGTNAVIGGDPLQAEIEWYTRTSEFFERANDRFARYARDPGRLFYDFLNEVLIPAAEEQRVVNQAELDEIRENRDRLIEFDDGLTELRVSIDTFIELQPDVIEAQIRERWDPINEWWVEVENVFLKELMRIVNGVFDAVEERHEQQLKINAVVAAKANNPGQLAGNIIEMTAEEMARAGGAFDLMIGVSQDDEYNEVQDTVRTIMINYDEITADYIRALGEFPALAFEPADTLIGRNDLPLDIPSPFVGDY